jgi:imidazolonepropionase-like amidohydrolase
MIRGGVKFLVGQDGINPSGTFSEMRLLKDCGLSETEIIKGATIYPARWLGVENRLGSLSPGKQADIVILDKNPLDDIDNVKSTFLVLKQGKEVFRKSG